MSILDPRRVTETILSQILTLRVPAEAILVAFSVAGTGGKDNKQKNHSAKSTVMNEPFKSNNKWRYHVSCPLYYDN